MLPAASSLILGCILDGDQAAVCKFVKAPALTSPPCARLDGAGTSLQWPCRTRWHPAAPARPPPPGELHPRWRPSYSRPRRALGPRGSKHAPAPPQPCAAHQPCATHHARAASHTTCTTPSAPACRPLLLHARRGQRATIPHAIARHRVDALPRPPVRPSCRAAAAPRVSRRQVVVRAEASPVEKALVTAAAALVEGLAAKSAAAAAPAPAPVAVSCLAAWPSRPLPPPPPLPAPHPPAPVGSRPSPTLPPPLPLPRLQSPVNIDIGGTSGYYDHEGPATEVGACPAARMPCSRPLAALPCRPTRRTHPTHPPTQHPSPPRAGVRARGDCRPV
jgi:hypothetical protein